MSFMLEIEMAQARRPELDELARIFFTQRNKKPDFEFCHRLFGAESSDEVIARRLGVAISTVREWRSIGGKVRTCR